jgi:hypothetical protein
MPGPEIHRSSERCMIQIREEVLRRLESCTTASGYFIWAHFEVNSTNVLMINPMWQSAHIFCVDVCNSCNA